MLIILANKDADRNVRVLRPFWVIEANGDRRVAMPGEELTLPWVPAAEAVGANRAEYVDLPGGD